MSCHIQKRHTGIPRDVWILEKFIRNFSTIVTPLTDLTEKGRPMLVECSHTLLDAFQHLKGALSYYLMMTTATWDRPFIFQMDASDTGIGYVLSQKDELGEELHGFWIQEACEAREKLFYHRVPDFFVFTLRVPHSRLILTSIL